MANKAPDLEIDEKSVSSFINWYHKLPKDDRALRIFDRKGFFSVHGADTAVAAKLYGGSGVVKQLGRAPTQLASVTLNRSLYEQLLRTVLVESANRSVELYEGHGATWQVARKASPGRLAAFEEELFSSVDMVDTPVVMAVASQMVEGSRCVGVAFVDAATRRLGAAQFEDDEQLCALERVFVQLGAKEVVIPQDTAAQQAENEKLERVAGECDALVTRRPRSTFAAKAAAGAAEPLLKERSVQQHDAVFERPQAAAALAAVLAFTDLSSNPDSHGRFTLELYKPDDFMRLDMAAQRALHIFPARGEARASSTSSVYGILNHTRTAMGKRLLRTWLKQPLTDVAAISERHTIVEALVDDAEMREALRDAHLRGVADIQRLVRKLSAKKVSLQELCQLYMASSQLPALIDALSGHTGDAAEVLKQRYIDELAAAHGEEALVKFEELLEAAIDLDAVPEEYLIDAGYDERLKGIKEEKAAAAAAVAREAAAAADDLGLELDKTVKLEWFKSANTALRCLRITPKEEKSARKALQGSKYVVLETRKDGTKFTTHAMKDAAVRLNDSTKAYSDVQRSLIDSVRDVAATFVQVWELVAALLAELDVLASFAHVATSSPGPFVRPEMLPAEGGDLSLAASRHPCLELQDGVDVIPNDCELRRGASWFQLITGPNMGGKSTYIRQVGVCVLMAQVGSFVPCDAARIAVRDAIFARVGAGDCQQKGVSTFMAEMLETAAILKGASHRSLLIIDELGRGTSTYDGFGLAWALSEHIMQVIGAPTLFATHFHELTAITGPCGVKNRHMATALEAGSGKLTMLYRVNDGACDQSFGIHVAEFANFPPAVIERAKAKLAELEASGAPQAQVGAKRPRDGDEAGDKVAEARQAMRTFLKSVSELPVDSAQPAALKAQVQGLRQGLLAQAADNDALRKLMGPTAQAAQ